MHLVLVGHPQTLTAVHQPHILCPCCIQIIIIIFLLLINHDNEALPHIPKRKQRPKGLWTLSFINAIYSFIHSLHINKQQHQCRWHFCAGSHHKQHPSRVLIVHMATSKVKYKQACILESQFDSDSRAPMLNNGASASIPTTKMI